MVANHLGGIQAYIHALLALVGILGLRKLYFALFIVFWGRRLEHDISYETGSRNSPIINHNYGVSLSRATGNRSSRGWEDSTRRPQALMGTWESQMEGTSPYIFKAPLRRLGLILRLIGFAWGLIHVFLYLIFKIWIKRKWKILLEANMIMVRLQGEAIRGSYF